MNTLLYGGAFDPPHKGHEEVIRLLLRQKGVDRVVCVPSGNRSEKSYKTQDKHRLAMLKLLSSEVQDARFSIDFDCISWELPITTTVAMQEHYTKKFWWEVSQVFGTEEAKKMWEWFQGEKVCKEIPKIFVIRKGEMPDFKWLENYVLVDEQLAEDVSSLSSTQIRESVKNTIFSWLQPLIRDYIVNNHLYELHE